MLLQTLGSLGNGDASQKGSEKRNWETMEKEMIRPVTLQNLSTNLWVHSLRFFICLFIIDWSWIWVCACVCMHAHTHALTCRGHRLTLGIFLSWSLSLFFNFGSFSRRCRDLWFCYFLASPSFPSKRFPISSLVATALDKVMSSTSATFNSHWFLRKGWGFVGTSLHDRKLRDLCR